MFKYNTMNMGFNKYFSIAKSEVKQAIVDNKRLVLLMFALYVVFFIIGVILSSEILAMFHSSVNSVGAHMTKSSALDPALELFIHNEYAGIQTYVFSIFFGIFAFVSTMLNGALMGLFGGLALTKGPVYGISMFIALVAPHGIFEIPANILESVAGVLLFLFIFRFFKTIHGINDGSSFKLKAKKSWEVNKIYFKQSIVLMVFSCMLLVIAAIIEGHITDHIGNWVESFFK